MSHTMPIISLLAQAPEQPWANRLWFRQAPNSIYAHGVDELFMFIVWVCVISFVIVIGLAYYFAWKYRRRPGVPTQRSPSHNTPLELAWSIVPLLVMVFIFFKGFHLYMNKVAAPGGAEVIRINARQWDWSARYDNGREIGPEEWKWIGNKSSPVIMVPRGRPVKFMMTSTDVIHSFYIPAMRIKFDVFPNRFTSFWIQPEYNGDFEIYCAEYCGRDHSEMNAWLRVMDPEEYFAAKQAEVVIDDPVEFGEYLYRQKGCIACHTLDGTASTGPTWQGLWGTPVREFSNAPPRDISDETAFRNYLRTSIYDPNAEVVRGYPAQMNSYQGQIDERQLDGLIAFIMSPQVSGRAGPPPAAPSPAPTETPAQPADDQPPASPDPAGDN